MELDLDNSIYVTTDLNYFVITPISHIVSQLVAYKAKNGTPLASTYMGAGTALSLGGKNHILQDDAKGKGRIAFLKAVPGASGDTLNTYKDVLTGIEWYGVRYDLPSSVVIRILTVNLESGSQDGVDGSNTPINVGKWVNGVFDQTIPFTFDELTALGSTISTVSGRIVHEPAVSYIATYLIQSFYRAGAFTNDAAQAALLSCYPGDQGLFPDATLKAAACNTATQGLAALKTRIATNNRSK